MLGDDARQRRAHGRGRARRLHGRDRPGRLPRRQGRALPRGARGRRPARARVRARRAHAAGPHRRGVRRRTPREFGADVLDAVDIDEVVARRITAGGTGHERRAAQLRDPRRARADDAGSRTSPSSALRSSCATPESCDPQPTPDRALRAPIAAFFDASPDVGRARSSRRVLVSTAGRRRDRRAHRRDRGVSGQRRRRIARGDPRHHASATPSCTARPVRRTSTSPTATTTCSTSSASPRASPAPS